MRNPLSWRSALATVVLATAATAITTGSAAAAGDPWTNYHQSDLSYRAGTACADSVHVHVVDDKERYRTDLTYPDGTPRSQTWLGALHVQYINTATGASVERDLDAKAVITYTANGRLHSITSENGAFGANIPPSSNIPRGLYVLSGRGTSLTVNAIGTRTVSLGEHGTAEPICPLISP